MSHTLFELNEFLRRVIALNLPEPLWVKAELADIGSSKGHIYLDLVQKAEDGHDPIAQGQAVIWSRNLKTLQKRIGADLQGLLQPGMEILFLARVEFHERYGLKLMVEDIDPAHTIGKLELQRRETIRKLQAQDLIGKNANLPLPLVVQRIAVLSAEQAAGLQDFKNHLRENTFGYGFLTRFFPVAVQGAQVEKEVTLQLEKIAKQQLEFDAVAIIRGGGARLNLAAFDSFQLAKTVANFPLPVLVGIGHDVDETVLDLVANRSLKTPTAVADFIIQHNMLFEAQIQTMGSTVKNLVSQKIQGSRQRLGQLSQWTEFHVRHKLQHQGQMLDFIKKEIPINVRHQFAQQSQQLHSMAKLIQLLGPAAAMRRGFALVFRNGTQITDVEKLSVGDTVEVQLNQGSFYAAVKTTKK